MPFSFLIVFSCLFSCLVNYLLVNSTLQFDGHLLQRDDTVPLIFCRYQCYQTFFHGTHMISDVISTKRVILKTLIHLQFLKSQLTVSLQNTFHFGKKVSIF